MRGHYGGRDGMPGWDEWVWFWDGFCVEHIVVRIRCCDGRGMNSDVLPFEILVLIVSRVIELLVLATKEFASERDRDQACGFCT